MNKLITILVMLATVRIFAASPSFQQVTNIANGVGANDTNQSFVIGKNATNNDAATLMAATNYTASYTASFAATGSVSHADTVRFATNASVATNLTSAATINSPTINSAMLAAAFTMASANTNWIFDVVSHFAGANPDFILRASGQAAAALDLSPGGNLAIPGTNTANYFSGNGGGLTSLTLQNISTNFYTPVVTNAVSLKIPFAVIGGVTNYLILFTNIPPP